MEESVEDLLIRGPFMAQIEFQRYLKKREDPALESLSMSHDYWHLKKKDFCKKN